MNNKNPISVIVCGDFNSGIDKPAVSMIFGDQLSLKGIDIGSKEEIIY